MVNTRIRHIVLLAIIGLVTVFLFSPLSSASGTETLITTGTPLSNQYSPSVWGDNIVWEDQRSGSVIYLYNMATGIEQKISDPTVSVHSPRIQGDNVVWIEADANGGDIFLYNIISKTITQITNYPAVKINPDIYGTKIIWQEEIYPDDGRGYAYYDVIMHDTDTGLTSHLTNCADPAGPTTSHESPSINGDTVVWVDWDDVRGTFIIVMMDTSAADPAEWMETTVSDPAVVDIDQTAYPRLSGQYIVWGDPRNGDWDVFLYDTLNPPEQDILNPHNANTQRYPAISGSKIVYQDDSHLGPNSYQLGLYDIEEGVTDYPLTAAQQVAGDSFPSINGNRIVWQDNRHPGGQMDIYLFTIGGTGECPVADFTPASAAGPPPLTVAFSDTSSPIPAHWHWDFGDRTSSTSRTVSHTYSSVGTFRVNLTVGTSNCRTMSEDHIISVGPPSVSFTGSPTEGMVPLTVTFNSAGTIGTVDTWDWDFDNDGTVDNHDQDPVHTYATAGTYSVRLDATNTDGTGTKTRTSYITVKPGIRETATTTISGFTIVSAGSVQQLAVDKSLFGAANHILPDSSMLVTKPAPGYGWQNITFLSNDGTTFTESPTDISGAFRRTFLQTKDIRPTTFPDVTVGSGCSISYLMDYFSYPTGGTLTTDVWEGTLPTDYTNFYHVISDANFDENFASMNVAYTINIARSGMTTPSNATVNMSVKSSWVSIEGDLEEGRQRTHVIATGYDSGRNFVGTVLPARYQFTRNGYDYFIADVPPSMTYLTKFAPAKLSGSGNVFQMVYLAVVTHFVDIQSSSDTSGGPGAGTGKGTGQGLTSQESRLSVPAPEPPAAPEAKSVDLFINDQAVVTQTTVLQSVDQLATLSIGQGVVARDATGNPLSSVTIETMPDTAIPGTPQGSTISFAGIAYNLQPDGATFSPATTITFSVPQAQWSLHYTIKEYDMVTQAWVDLPTTYHPESGTISASLSNFCIIALFSDTIKPSQTPPPTIVRTPLPTLAPPPPTSAFGVFYGMVVWLVDVCMKNVYLILIVAAIAVAFSLNRRRKGRDPFNNK